MSRVSDHRVKSAHRIVFIAGVRRLTRAEAKELYEHIAAIGSALRVAEYRLDAEEHGTHGVDAYRPPETCRVCGFELPADDSLPLDDGRVHVQCALQRTLDLSRAPTEPGTPESPLHDTRVRSELSERRAKECKR